MFPEVHRDFCRRIRNMRDEATAQLERIDTLNRVDWQKVEEVMKKRSGIAEDVTL
jgi:hypothetical protein